MKFMIQVRPWASYVKEKDFFISQGGDTQDWGKAWLEFDAIDLEAARDIGRGEREAGRFTVAGDKR